MYQLRNLINRTAVPLNPADNMKAAEDFLLLLLHAHVIAGARVLLAHGIQGSVATVAKSLVSTFLQLPHFQETADAATPRDGVHLYAQEVLTMGMLWHGFHDATREGDGDRVLVYWKFLLIAFHSANRFNYSKEAVNLLLQHQYLLSPQKAAQLQWSRFVNTRGLKGHNISCDLHMEHLNRRLKTILRNMGANVNPHSVVRAGKCVRIIHQVCLNFESETAKGIISDHHPYPSFEKDLAKVVKVLEEEDVLIPLNNRQHASFKLKSSLLRKHSYHELLQWITAQVKKIMHY